MIGLAVTVVVAELGAAPLPAAQTPILDSVRVLDGRIRTLEVSIESTRAALAAGETENARLASEEAALERAIAAGRSAAARQVRALHRIVPRERASTGLSPFEEAKLIAGMRRVVGAERKAIARFHDLVSALVGRRKAAAALRVAQASRHADLVAERDRLARERDTRLGIVSRFHQDRVFGRRARVELLAASDALDQSFPANRRDAATGGAARSTPPFGRLRRRMPPPVDGVVEVPFGPRYDEDLASAVFHKGVDVRAPLGAPVRAISDGTVVFTGVHAGYGDIVIIDHGDEYFSLSAHLSRTDVRIGDAVARGETIGAVGDSGSFKGAYLYFEIRHRERPINPLLWFRRAGAR